MHIRPKTKRRLSILVGVLLVVAGLLFGLYQITQSRLAKKVAAEREAAMTAYQAGDYAGALPHLAFYLDKGRSLRQASVETDAEALLAYGESRRKVELPRGRHLFEAKNIFQQCLRLQPNNLQAQHALLELYPIMHYEPEALDLADSVLARDPNDVVALRAKVEALRNQRNLDQAFVYSQKLNEIAPLDLRGQAATQNLLLALKRPPEEIIQRASELLKAHVDDPRFELLLATAYGEAQQHEQATKWLRSAASHTSGDLDLVTKLTAILDRYGMFTDAQQVLERAATQNSDPRLSRALVQRTWENGGNQEVADRLASLDPKSSDADSELLAYRALSLYALERTAEAAPIVDALAARKDDAPAAAWSIALKARFGGQNLPPRELIKQYQSAIDRDPDNPVVRFMLGQAYSTLGESELAIEAWRQAAERAPSWATPLALISRTYGATGRNDQAFGAAKAAYRCNPNLPGLATLYVVSWFRTLDDASRTEDVARLLDVASQIQKQQPLEPETLHVYVALLDRTGKHNEAIAAINAALKSDPPPPRETLINLATVSAQQRLGMETQLLDYAEKTGGSTPQVALSQALALADAGKADEGLKKLRAAQSGAKSDPLLWRLAVAQYREIIRDPDVLSEWIQLGDHNPQDLQVQSTILRARSRFQDRDFWQRTIDRAKAISGDEGVLWRTERARLLLTGNPTSKESAEAVNLLTEITKSYPTLVEAHRMLAGALERVGADKPEADKAEFVKRAIEELRAAAALNPDEPGATLDLARLLTASGNGDEAVKRLDRLVKSGSLSPAARQQIARVLAARGEWQRAVEVLLPAPAGDEPRDILLAGLYQHLNKIPEASALYQTLLASTAPDAEALAAAADFFASQRQPERAAKFLARLGESPLPPAQRELLLAHYAEHHGTADEALAHYVAATTAQGADVQAWREVAGYYLRQRKFAEASGAADAGLKVAADDADLKSLKLRADALQAYKTDKNVDSLIQVLSNDPRNSAAAEMLKVLSEAAATGQDPSKTTARLEALAGEHPEFAPLQAQLIRAYLELNDLSRAEALALRATEARPNDPELAQLLVAVYNAQGTDGLQRKLNAARQWRTRSAEQPLEPDLVIASTLLQLHRPSDAIETLAPYAASSAVANGNTAVAGVYARALIAAGRVQEAASLLQPLATASPRWRATWLGLSSAFRESDEASAWIGKIAPAVPKESAPEQQNLAEAWFTAGQQCHDPKLTEKARGIIRSLVERPDAPTGAWLLFATDAETQGDLPAAERGYREYLKKQPESVEARNNLAYVLLTRGRNEDLAEAQSLAEQATKAMPASATFHDTLARVYAKQGKRDEAIKTFEKAIALDRDSVEAMIGLADVLSQSGRAQEARAMLPDIEKRTEIGTPLTAVLQQQLDAVRSAVKQLDQSGSTQ